MIVKKSFYFFMLFFCTSWKNLLKFWWNVKILISKVSKHYKLKMYNKPTKRLELIFGGICCLVIQKLHISVQTSNFEALYMFGWSVIDSSLQRIVKYVTIYENLLAFCECIWYPRKDRHTLYILNISFFIKIKQNFFIIYIVYHLYMILGYKKFWVSELKLR